MIIISKIFLEKKYIINKKSASQIAKDFGCCANTILKYLRKYNIKLRKIGSWLVSKPGHWIGIKMKEKTKHKISKKLKGRKFSKETLRKMSISNSFGHRKDYSGKYTGCEGYTYIHVKYHPNKIGNNYILEHRLVIEAHLNKISIEKWIEYGRNNNYPKKVRFLNKSEVIHHIDGNRSNNAISNLMLFPDQSSHHKFKHINEKTFICKFCGKNQKDIR